MTSNRKPHKARSIEKIKSGKLLERLIKHAMGTVDMTSTQIRAAEICLKKVMPDLKSMELSGRIGGEKPIGLTERQLDEQIEQQLAAASTRKEAQAKG